MRKEYNDLSKQIEKEDAKQKQNMAELQREVELHKRHALDYQKQIKKLEKLNLQYQQDMGTDQLRKIQERQHILMTGELLLCHVTIFLLANHSQNV